MRPRYSFSSRHTRQARDPKNIRKQKTKFPDAALQIMKDSDIILQVMDARFIEETRNPELEKKVKKLGKKLINVANKSDITEKEIPKNVVGVSALKRKGISKLRDVIKIVSSKIKKEKVTVGVLGYPNTGKSSLINTLIGKSSAGTGAVAGYTKGAQKLKLVKGIVLIDSPGVIPKSEYTTSESKKLAKHAVVGAKTYTHVKDPEGIITEIINTYPGVLEKHYKIKAEGNAETLLEELGRKRSILKKGNEVDTDKTSRVILRDWQEGKIKN